MLESFPNVTVDMGAVKFMCNGANVMRPGIKNHTVFSKDEIVCIVEESQHKFLAVGKSLIDSSEMEQMTKVKYLKIYTIFLINIGKLVKQYSLVNFFSEFLHSIFVYNQYVNSVPAKRISHSSRTNSFGC